MRTMPRRVVKRRAAARRMVRAAKESSKATLQNHEASEEVVMQEGNPVVEVDAKTEEREEKKSVVGDVVENKIIDVKNQLAPEAVPIGSAVVKNNVEEVKESIDEYEKDERLDLEDNYPEYETEEYGGDEGQEEGDEVGEDPEEDVGEEESDAGDEEIEYVYEEVEVEDDDDDEHAGEENEPAQMADAEKVVQDEVVKGRRKQKDFEVFVGGLDKDATEDDLRKVFSEAGVIVEVRLMMNPYTKKNKGFAFLRFETVEQAKRAIAEIKNPMINGKQCGVAPSQDSDTLHLGNICKTWTKEALKEKLKHYGVENVEDLTLVEDSNNEGMNLGFAFLEFSSRSDAKAAYKRLQKRDVMFGVDKPAKVSFADSFIEPCDGVLGEAKTVFIDSLPPSWDEDYVRNLLKKYGEIEKIELASNMPTAHGKNYGIVTFGTHASAAECVDSITSAGLGEGDKVNVRAKLSRPLRRGRGKHASRGGNFSGRNPRGVARPPRSRPAPPRSLPARVVRGIGNRVRPVSVRGRHPLKSVPVRARPVAPPARSYDRRPAAPAYPKHSMKRAYGRREDLPPPRSRVPVDYGSRVASQRRPSYRDYPARDPGYSELPRSTSHVASRRGDVDGGYGQRFERPPPPSPHLSYHGGHPRDDDTLPNLKRPYTAIDDVPPWYADTDVRQSRARLDYDYGGSASQYSDPYGDRLGRSSLGYNGSRSSISTQDTHGMYSTRQGRSYGGGSSGVAHSSSYGDEYMSRRSDLGGSSYSSMYSGRGLGGSSSYISGSGSGSYY